MRNAILISDTCVTTQAHVYYPVGEKTNQEHAVLSSAQGGLSYLNAAVLQSQTQFTPFMPIAPADSTFLDLIHYVQKGRTDFRRATVALLVQDS